MLNLETQKIFIKLIHEILFVAELSALGLRSPPCPNQVQARHLSRPVSSRMPIKLLA